MSTTTLQPQTEEHEKAPQHKPESRRLFGNQLRWAAGVIRDALARNAQKTGSQ